MPPEIERLKNCWGQRSVCGRVSKPNSLKTISEVVFAPSPETKRIGIPTLRMSIGFV